MNDILINEDEMKLIISSLDDKTKKLEDIYNELNNKVKVLDGTSDVWTGSAREAAYNKYTTISNNFTSTVNQIKALKIFLENTLNNYLSGDQKINESIENNKEELKVN